MASSSGGLETKWLQPIPGHLGDFPLEPQVIEIYSLLQKKMFLYLPFQVAKNTSARFPQKW